MITIKVNLNAKEIGNRIKSTLKQLNLKQTDLVNGTKISKTAISNYILGNRIPDTYSIYTIANFLNVSIEWLLTGEEKKVSLPKEESNILDKYKLLTERNKLKVEIYIEEKVAEQESDY